MLIVLLPDAAVSAEQLTVTALSWWRTDATGLEVESGQHSLTELRTRFPAERLRALAPATAVSLHRVAIPVRSASAARAALPFALEDQLGQELEDLHLVAGPRRADGQYSAAVVSREQMERWLAGCTASGWQLEALLPQASLHTALAPEQGLRVQPSPWPGGGQALVTSADAEPVLVEIGMLSFWLQQRLARLGEGQQTVELQGYSATELGLRESVERALAPAVVAKLEAALKQAQQRRTLNLLTGAYTKGMAVPPWRKLRPLIMVATLLMVTWIGLQVVESMALKRERQRVLIAIDQLFAETLPNSRRVDPVTQFRQVLDSRDTPGGMAATGELLFDVLAIVRSNPRNEIKHFRATPDELEIEVQVPSFAELENVRSKLNEVASLSETLQGADSASEGVVARLKVQRGDL